MYWGVFSTKTIKHTFSPFIRDNLIKCDYYDPEQFNKLGNDFSNTISYFHLNCRSLSSNWESFKELLLQLHSDTFSFDFLGVSEAFNCDRDGRLSLPAWLS